MEDLLLYVFLALAFVLGLLIIGIAVWYFGFKRIDQDDGPVTRLLYLTDFSREVSCVVTKSFRVKIAYL